MLLIPWHKDRVSGADTDPRSGLVHFTFASVKNLVFPGVGMPRRVSTRRKIKRRMQKLSAPSPWPMITRPVTPFATSESK